MYLEEEEAVLVHQELLALKMGYSVHLASFIHAPGVRLISLASYGTLIRAAEQF